MFGPQRLGTFIWQEHRPQRMESKRIKNKKEEERNGITTDVVTNMKTFCVSNLI